jgi:hypothetical protein
LPQDRAPAARLAEITRSRHKSTMRCPAASGLAPAIGSLVRSSRRAAGHQSSSMAQLRQCAAMVGGSCTLHRVYPEVQMWRYMILSVLMYHGVDFDVYAATHGTSRIQVTCGSSREGWGGSLPGGRAAHAGGACWVAPRKNAPASQWRRPAGPRGLAPRVVYSCLLRPISARRAAGQFPSLKSSSYRRDKSRRRKGLP